MTSYIFSIDLGYDVLDEYADFVFCIHPVKACKRNAQNVVREHLLTTPLLRTVVSEETGKGDIRVMRLRAPRGLLTVHYDATVEFQPVQPQWSATGFASNDLPVEVLPYLTPSPHCQSGHVAALARREFGHLATREAKVNVIHRWITEHVNFALVRPGSKAASGLAGDMAGVVRDFAHLMIASCRTLGIPARLVTGVDCAADDLSNRSAFGHYVEVFLDGLWRLYDPRTLSRQPHVLRFGAGRDAADIPMVSIAGEVKADIPVIHVSALSEETAPVHGRPSFAPSQASAASS